MTGNPQTENGYMRLATELQSALCRTRIPGEARQVFDAILLKTYGFNKRDDAISLSQFQQLTGMGTNHICRALNILLSMNLITKDGSRGINVYSPNKRYDTWKPLPKKGLPNMGLPKKGLPNSGPPIRESGTPEKENLLLPKTGDTKDTLTKDNLTKDNGGRLGDASPDVVDPLEDEFRRFLPFASKVLGQPKAFTPSALSKWRARRLKWSPRELAEAFANLSNEPDRWKITNNGHRPLAWWLHSDDRIEEMRSCHLKGAVSNPIPRA